MNFAPLLLLRAPLSLAWRDDVLSLTTTAHVPDVPDVTLSVSDAAALPDAIARLLAAHRHRRVAWRLGDEHARLFHVERPRGVRSARELEVALRQHAHAWFGDAVDAWALRWTGRPFARADTVCALPQALLDAIDAGGRRAGVHCASLRCDWVAAAARAPRRGRAWVLNVGAHALTLGLLDAGRCVGLRRLAPVAPDDDLADVMARAQALFGGPPADALAPIWLFGAPLRFPLGLAAARARRLDGSALSAPLPGAQTAQRVRVPEAGR